jgi:hypothetical protein
VKRLENPVGTKEKIVKKRRLEYEVLDETWGEEILFPPLTEPVSDGEGVPPEPIGPEIQNGLECRDSTEDQNVIVSDVSDRLRNTRLDSICQNNYPGSVVPVLAVEPVLSDTTSTATISQVVIPDSSANTIPSTKRESNIALEQRSWLAVITLQSWP